MIKILNSELKRQATSSGIISYNSGGQKEGVCIASSSGYSKVEFYKGGYLIGSIGLSGTDNTILWVVSTLVMRQCQA